MTTACTRGTAIGGILASVAVPGWAARADTGPAVLTMPGWGLRESCPR